MGKKLSPQALVRRMMTDLTQSEIGQIVGLGKKQVGRIARGEASGASVEAALREYAGLGKRAKASVKSGELELPSKRTPPPKKAPPVEAPAPPPPPKEAEAIPSPPKVELVIKGNMGPSKDPDYLRKRTIRKTLEGPQAERFKSLWARDQFKALKYATSAYFGSSGEGHLESVIGTPYVKFSGG